MFDKNDLIVAGAVGAVGAGLAIWAVTRLCASSNTPSMPSKRILPTRQSLLEDSLQEKFTEVWNSLPNKLMIDGVVYVDNNLNVPRGVYRDVDSAGRRQLVFVSKTFGNMIIKRRANYDDTRLIVFEYHISRELAERMQVAETGTLDSYSDWFQFVGTAGYQSNCLHFQESLQIRAEQNAEMLSRIEQRVQEMLVPINRTRTSLRMPLVTIDRKPVAS